ncbi:MULTISPECIES: protein-methionine-sulfoxide reductase catalytic subunit MsrP [unclassified Paracoccus (in: a-proteobacteria)]|uniref:protein-methionine-sulfoxide reductase catalytic subunit MsrP n=1 Tax=unclassified Paracoccus (in: a-proteobacteria) TaxID=2688777 RepID=UPI0012B38589|nr:MULTISPECIES: protein-methionine-sulfoxide reductase catalytic subunit MsrP [unclassified Paracoccus (in: a-proteobacteria)]UXU75692.1 protein-methionine-sulfoxide reductase catalytic subunit MsrP [Paracoccus sp. SMMA_5]UXU81597.1 protein-methionine-sulfoxide reductase catalytic subunit MsrP [Paracoccus sp. SMMA_5_TC]
MKLTWADVTPQADYLRRRSFLAGGLALLATPALALTGKPSPFSTDEKPNSLKDITNYNNFYEFGTGKTDPARHASSLRTSPWSVRIDGLVERPGNYAVEDIAPESALEERIYRLRCVEAWSMVIPWLGVPLAGVLDRAGVRPGAKYVAFQTLLDPEQMPGQRSRLMDWPYREGLRLDEAMHPLTILATGLYGEVLPNQNGAPIRLVVPWKYGFKSIKSVVSITLTDKKPATSWQSMQPQEYGFYANVNPQVDHPRWSQATERRIGAGLLGGRQETLMFNGYGEQVAGLYAGMDLRRDY